MTYFIEAWNAKASWMALSEADRAAYMNQVGAHIQGLLDQGVQVLTWSVNEENTSRKMSFDYFAIWSFPDESMAKDFQQLVENAGWYDYFEQENLMGEATTAEQVIGKLIGL